MKIAIDCRWITTDIGGIRNYTLNLVRSLLLIDKKNSYYIVYDREEAKQVIEKFIKNEQYLSLRAEYIFFPCGPFTLKSQFILPSVLNKLRIDVFHSANFMIPLLFNKYKIIITIHDLIPYLFPKWCHKSKKIKYYWIFKKIIELAVMKADIIITDSVNSRNDIIKAMPYSKNKVEVIYISISKEFKKIYDTDILREFKYKFNLPLTSKLILYLGRQDPAKNLINLVKSFIKLLKLQPDIYLVIAGKADERYMEPYDIAEKNNIRDRIILTGILEFEDVVKIYNACDIFVFPSLYEGFGLPPLEAMACGLPVITTNVSSLPEVVGDAALMVDPFNTDEIADNMYKLLNDAVLRKKLIEKGIQRVKIFNWEKAARLFLEIIEGKWKEKN